jgi:hypothetical protein
MKTFIVLILGGALGAILAAKIIMSPAISIPGGEPITSPQTRDSEANPIILPQLIMPADDLPDVDAI